MRLSELRVSPNVSCPEVVVIVPVFNSLPYLEDLCESLSRQEYQGRKWVVFVDDGSSDGSVELLEEIQIEGFAKTVLAQRHRGLSFARNRGLAWIAEAKPDFSGYVMFLDSDDFLSRNALQAVCWEMKQNNLDQLFFGANVFFENEQLAKDFSSYSTYYERGGTYNGVFAGPEYMEECVRQGDFIPNACMQLLSYPFLEKHGIRFFEGIIHEDNLFTYTCLLCAERVAFLNKPLYQRRIRPNSIMTSHPLPENVVGYFRCGEQALLMASQTSSLKKGQREAFFSIVDTWFSAAADYLTVLGEEGNRRALNILDVRSELLYRQTVLARVVGRESASRFAENARTEGCSEGYEQARLELLQSKSFKIGRAITAIPRKLLGR